MDHLSFNVKRSGIFGLLDPNGVGKTTTIRMLATLTRPTEGTTMIGDYYIVEDDNEVRKLVCLVSEKIIMYDWLTAKENLWFFGRLYDVPKEVLNKRIDARYGTSLICESKIQTTSKLTRDRELPIG